MTKGGWKRDVDLVRVYTGITRILSPLLPLWMGRRIKRGKDDPARKGERFGKAGRDRPEGLVFWMHGASVGECTMLLPVIDKVLAHFPNAHVLVTSMTMTAATLMAERLPERAFHQYAPLDSPRAVKAFLKHWQPDMAIWAESEIWPNLIRATKSRNIPMALINARMSQKSRDGWLKNRKTARIIFGCFDTILAAQQETADVLGQILGRNIVFVGNLKDAAQPLPVDAAQLKALARQIGNRPVWCAASTHPGEDAIILKAHQTVLKTHPEAVLILAPRHPERRADIAALLTESGLKFATRSTEQKITKTRSVYLFDTIGEMGLAYRLSHLSFVCGSLISGLSGHNPLEPARLENAVLTGTNIASFADIYMAMFAFHAAERVLNPDEIGDRVRALLSDTEALDALIQRGGEFAVSRDTVLDYVWTQLISVMPDTLAGQIE